jgi:hypothetical protein
LSSTDDDWNFDGTIKASRNTKEMNLKPEKPMLNIPPPPEIPATGWRSLKIIVDNSKSTFKKKKSVFESQSVHFIEN